MPGRSGKEIAPVPQFERFAGGGGGPTAAIAPPFCAPPLASGTHRAFRPVTRPEVPDVRGPARADVDRFILAALEAKRLALNPEADRPTLVRRVAFDLPGLPPTVAEIDEFLADESPV